jgi:hypothetical protein
MSFASDITDARQLPSVCACNANMSTYKTTRTDRYSYEKRYRIERACLASQSNKFEMFEICLDNTRASRYAVGDYIQLNYGTPALLIYITSVDARGHILNIKIVNRPLFNSGSCINIQSKTLSGNGRGAVFSISVAPNRTLCCNCGLQQNDVNCTDTDFTYSEEPEEPPRNY